MFKYIYNDSEIHKIKPVYKVLSLFIYFILFIFVKNFQFSIIMLLFSITLCLTTKVSYKLYLYRLIPSLILSAIILILGIIFNINPLYAIFKVIAFSLYYSSYIFTTKFVDTNKGVFDIFYSFNIKNYKLNLTLTILINFISIVYQEYYEIKKDSKLMRLYYTIDKVIIRIKQLYKLNKVKAYNFNYKEKTMNLMGPISLISHLMLFMLYFL